MRYDVENEGGMAFMFLTYQDFKKWIFVMIAG
jgi:hypothetical protein